MKHVTLFAATVCCALSIISCTKDENILGGSNANGEVSTGQMISFNDPFLEVATRAEITSSTFINQRPLVKVFRGTTLQSELLLTYSSGKWVTSTRTPWFKNSTYNFKAVMPDNVKMNDTGDKIVNLPICNHINLTNDVLYAATNNLSSEVGMETGVNLNFKHIYNKLIFSFPAATGGYKAKITSAKLWFPKGNMVWDANSGSEFESNSIYLQKQEPAAITADNFSFKELPTGTAGTITGTNEYLILPPTKNGNTTMYAYLDLEYSFVDSNSVPFETKTINKLPIEFKGSEGFGNGGKALKLTIKFDSSDVKDISFTSSLTNWDSTLDNTANY